MKRRELAITALLVILIIGGIFAAFQVPVVPAGDGEPWPVSDRVTMADPNRPTPQQQEQGIEILRELINN